MSLAANTEEIASGIAGGVVFVLIIVLLIIYRNWRYEQELDSLLWKIDYKDIQIPDLPGAASGQGKAPRVGLFLRQVISCSLFQNPFIRRVEQGEGNLLLLVSNVYENVAGQLSVALSVASQPSHPSR